jgi:hypothetical protein
VIPIVDGVLRERIISEILAVTLADNTKARMLFPDGSYQRAARTESEPVRHSQAEFIRLAQTEDHPRNPTLKAKARYPRMQLAPSPFGKTGAARKRTKFKA